MDPGPTEWQRRCAAMHRERFSARTLDAGGALTPSRLRDVVACFTDFGAVHVLNTGLRDVADLTKILAPLGFGEAERFTLGGRTSAEVQARWVTPGLRRMDHYPAALYLLPNNEVQYRRCGPARVLFYCRTPAPVGGRSFVHSAEAVEAGILAAGADGASLLAKIRAHGLTIETGFLDRGSSHKRENYFQSWQERFETDDPAAAMARARAHTDEYDACWWRSDDAPERPTLMTRITLRGFKTDARGKGHLRFPRIALDEPAARNGFRRFPLGNGEELSEREREILREVYLATREGTLWHAGDVLLFDNVRYGHSRESFSGEREVFVAMAGEVWEDPAPLPSPQVTAPPEVPRYAQGDAAERYALPPEATRWTQEFSARTFDAGGALTDAVLSAARAEFRRYGALHLRNTGLRCPRDGDLPDGVRDALGFSDHEAFPWGGTSSGRTTRRALSKALRATDDYPPGRWLLPHNEVLYQRHMPARLLFFSAQPGDRARGGRTFVHGARRFEHWLRAQGAPGEELLNALRTHGFLIEMGFLDEGHPDKDKNYFRSWQDRFETHDRDEALARCRAATLQFDEAWWREERLDGGGRAHTLMTRIRIPAYCQHPEDFSEYALFPRIALDAPRIENGYRIFPRGDGTPFTDAENDLLLGAFLATREGVHYGQGDILLVDNVRYGHSRESYAGPRSLGVAMAGRVFTNDVPKEAR